MAIKKNLEIDQGALFSETYVLKDGNDVLINLTGHTFAGKIKDKVGGTTKATLTITNSAPTTGKIVVSLSASDSAALTLESSDGPERKITTWCYDIEWTRGAGDIVRLLEGLVHISPEATS